MEQFAVGSALMYLFVTTSGTFAGGYLSDKYEDADPRSKSWISAASTATALPVILISLTQQDNFWLSFGMLVAHYTVSEMWISPTCVMI